MYNATCIDTPETRVYVYIVSVSITAAVDQCVYLYTNFVYGHTPDT